MAFNMQPGASFIFGTLEFQVGEDLAVRFRAIDLNKSVVATSATTATSSTTSATNPTKSVSATPSSTKLSTDLSSSTTSRTRPTTRSTSTTTSPFDFDTDSDDDDSVFCQVYMADTPPPIQKTGTSANGGVNAGDGGNLPTAPDTHDHNRDRDRRVRSPTRRRDLNKEIAGLEERGFYATPFQNTVAAKTIIDSLIPTLGEASPAIEGLKRAQAMLGAAAVLEAPRNSVSVHTTATSSFSRRPSRQQRRRRAESQAASSGQGRDPDDHNHHEHNDDDDHDNNDHQIDRHREGQRRGEREERRRGDQYDRRNRHRDGRDEGRARSPPDLREELNRRYREKDREGSPVRRGHSIGIKAYSTQLRRVSWPQNFKPAGIEKYEGNTDPREWLAVYELAIEAAGGDTGVMANYLPIALSPAARSWLMGLPDRTIETWDDLRTQFIGNFQATYDRPGTEWDLAQVKQEKGESTRKYIQRFCNKRNTIPDIQDHAVIRSFIDGLRNDRLFEKLARSQPKTVKDMLHIADKYALSEEALQKTRSKGDEKKDKPHDKKKQGDQSKKDQKRKADNFVGAVEGSGKQRKSDYDQTLDSPCVFHSGAKHLTRHCNILRGLARSVNPEAGSSNKKKPTESKSKDKGKEKAKDDDDDEDEGSYPKVDAVLSIIGGPEAYEGKRKKKATSREVMAVAPATPSYLDWSEVPITFDRTDHPLNLPKPGRYPLILAPIIGTTKMSKVMIDGGSTLNILFAKTFDALGLKRSDLKPSRSPFHGIIPGKAATPIGTIWLEVTFGSKKNFRTELIKFEVADIDSSYQAIIGRPGITKFMAIPHYPYLMLKMPGPKGVISLRGDVRLAHELEQESLVIADRAAMAVEAQQLKREVEQGVSDQELGPPPTKKQNSSLIDREKVSTKTVQLDPADPTKVAYIGTELDPK